MIVSHRNGSYPIHFCDIEHALSEWPRSAVLITDETVFSLYQSQLPAVPRIVIPEGEQSKSSETWIETIRDLARKGVRRDATIIALGGGVVGDLAGFVAASYMRGLPYLQIPTTLLAQVDSSVGGKVGIDLQEGKNLVGAFYPPTEVRVADAFLDTLSGRQRANGMAEVLKYGFIMDGPILTWNHTRSSLVERCIECKKRIVEADEFETTGERAILNFGHTVGHAIEAECQYQGLLHGEAISIGMVVEAVLGEALHVTELGTAKAVIEILQGAQLPISHRLLQHPQPLIARMGSDKKATSGGLAMSLLIEIGECKLVKPVPEAAIAAAMTSVFSTIGAT